jgi:hypothetical protein
MTLSTTLMHLHDAFEYFGAIGGCNGRGGITSTKNTASPILQQIILDFTRQI